MTITQAVKELREYNKEHSFDPLKLQPVPAEFGRDVEFNDLLFHVLLTRLVWDGARTKMWMLSVSGDPREFSSDRLAMLQSTREDAALIAKEFFGEKAIPIAPDMQIGLSWAHKFLYLKEGDDENT